MKSSPHKTRTGAIFSTPAKAPATGTATTSLIGTATPAITSTTGTATPATTPAPNPATPSSKLNLTATNLFPSTGAVDPATAHIQQGVQDALDAAALLASQTLKKDASIANAGNAPPTTVAAALVKPADNTAIVTSHTASTEAYPVDIHLLNYASTDPVWKGILEKVKSEFNIKDSGGLAKLKDYIESK